jgi:hypothetical protein
VQAELDVLEHELGELPVEARADAVFDLRRVDGNAGRIVLDRGALPLGLPDIRLRAKRFGETSPERLWLGGGRDARSQLKKRQVYEMPSNMPARCRDDEKDGY